MRSGAALLVLVAACGGGPGAVVTIVDSNGDDSPPDTGPACETCPDTASCAACNVITQMGCCPDHKCTWALSTDPTASGPGLGSIACEPKGAVAPGGACTILPAAQRGYDNCVAGSVCVEGICEQICDNNAAISGCDASHACITHDGLFANEGVITTPAGVCEP